MKHTIMLCISAQPLTEKIEQGNDAAWANLYRNLVPVWLDTDGIADAVRKGHAIAPVLDGWRSYDHFISGQHIGIDMDTEDERSSIATLVDHDLVQMYGALIYSTPSSTPTAPRSRVVFLLDEAIENPYKYKAAIRTLSRYFPGHDKGSAEATRTFFGNHRMHSEGMFIPRDSCLPLADLREMHAAQVKMDQKKHVPQYNYTGHDIDLSKFVSTCITKAVPGNRNNMCYWMSCRLVEDGVNEDEQEEVVRQFAAAMHGDFTEQEALNCLRSARTGAR